MISAYNSCTSFQTIILSYIRKDFLNVNFGDLSTLLSGGVTLSNVYERRGVLYGILFVKLRLCVLTLTGLGGTLEIKGSNEGPCRCKNIGPFKGLRNRFNMILTLL